MLTSPGWSAIAGLSSTECNCTSNVFDEDWLSASNNWKNGRKIKYTKPINKTGMGLGTVDHKLPTNRVKLVSGHKYYVEVI